MGAALSRQRSTKAPGLPFDLDVEVGLDFGLSLNLNVASILDAFQCLQDLDDSKMAK